jgi:hypothetical protein
MMLSSSLARKEDDLTAVTHARMIYILQVQHHSVTTALLVMPEAAVDVGGLEC